MRRFGRKMGKVLALAGASAALAGAAGAEQALIRIEAKRDAEAAQQAARDWAAKLSEGPGEAAPVVVLPLPGGWTGIALGPMERDAAKARMGALKDKKTIPADSFISTQNMDRAVAIGAEAGEEGEPDSGGLGGARDAAQGAAVVAPESAAEVTDADRATEATTEATTEAPSAPPAAAPVTQAGETTPDTDVADAQTPQTETPQTETPALPDQRDALEEAAEAAAQAADAAAEAAAQGKAPLPQDAQEAAAPSEPGPAADPEASVSDAASSDYIQLEAKRDEVAAQEVLAKWRAEFPEAGLWRLDSGWYAVAIGPMGRESAQSWLDGFKSAGRIPKDAFISSQTDLGAPVDAGRAPDTANLPEPPPAPPVMPDTTEVQRALRWAGHYDGPIDGKAGKGTNDAIAADMAAEGLADADPAVAMTALVQRRADWRANAGLSRVNDGPSGLSLDLPEAKVEFQRREGPLTIFGPKGESGAAVILLSRKGNSTDLADLAGLVTALGWVPAPERNVTRDRFTLKGANDAHHSFAEATLANGMIQGFVLIWPAADAKTAQRMAAEISDSLRRTGPPQGPDLPPTPQTNAADEDSTADGVTSATGN